MAVVTITTKTDDLTGAEGDDVQTFYFGVDKVQYTIDLNEKNAAAFTKAIGKFVEKAREVIPEKPKRAGAPKARKARAANGTGPARRDMKPVRDWANANGYELKARGRISSDIVEAFDAAHPVTEAPAVEPQQVELGTDNG